MGKLRGTPAINVGGRYGINVELLTGDKTLVPGVDLMYQWLDPDEVDRIITLHTANAKAGDRFIIKHNGHSTDKKHMAIKENGTERDKIFAEGIKEFVFDGTNWVDAENGTGHGYDGYHGLALGYEANAYESGVALGFDTDAHVDGVAVGEHSKGYDYGIGIGYLADGHDRGVAIGDNTLGYETGTALGRSSNTNSKLHSIALGYRSKNTRDNELAINIGDEIEDDRRYQYQQIIVGGWIRKTSDATPTTMYVDMTSRFTIRPQSALAFNLMVTARDNTSGDTGAYMFRGLIKRDGANNTVLVNSSSYYVYEENPLWNCVIAADDTNEALQITVTGFSGNLHRWAARLDGVETSFVAA